VKKLDRFLLKSFVGPFILTFFIVVFVLAMQFLWLYIDELVGKGLGFGVIMEFMGWASATLIPMALPLATLLASIMTLGGMGERNELLAMKAAGISLKRILTPLIVFSCFISVGAFFASNNLVPVAYNKIYTLREDIGHTKEEINIPTGIFYDGIDGYILRIDNKNEESDMMYKLMIYDHTAGGGNTNMTLADSGAMKITEDKSMLIFDLYNGCSYQESNQMNYKDTVIELNRIFFNHQKMMISLKNYTFTRTDDDRFGDEVMARNLTQLQGDKDSLSILLDSLMFLQKERFDINIGLQHLYQLDSLYVTEGREKMPMAVMDSVIAVHSDDEGFIARSYAMISDLLSQSIEYMEQMEREDFRYSNNIRRIEIESFRKFTLSIACLIFFFIGAPLGAIIRKGGFGTPVIISIFFFLVYYIIDISGKKLARDGAISPLVGTIISSLVMLPIGIFLTRKSTQDSSLFNIDSYKELFKNWWKRVQKRYRKIKNFMRKDRGRVRIVFMGTPEFAVAPLKAILDNGFEVAAVVTVPDKQSGRGLKVNESDVKKFAIEKGLPVLQPVSLKDPEFLEQLRGYNANLFVVVAFRMLPKEVWTMPELGTFNLHASLLPQYRGAAPINWAIINGEKQTGVTTFMLDEQIDTGQILFQESCLIEEYDNLGTLHDKLQAIGSNLVIKTIEAIRDHTIKPIPQDTTYLNLRPAPKIHKETCKIDWSKSARQIELLIRGLSPYPAAFSELTDTNGEVTTMKIFEAFTVESSQPDAPVGTVKSDGKSFIEIKCGEGSIKLLDIQLSGKKRMDVKSFLLGFREPERYRFS